MNKVSLLTLGKKLQDGNLYVLSVYDVEPSGVIIHAYDQTNSKEFTLPVSEHEFTNSGYSRSTNRLQELIDTIEIVPQGSDFILQSSDERISKIKQRLTGEALAEMMKSSLSGSNVSLNELLVTGLVELSKVKPVGLDAVKWLGEWFLANNPTKPNVVGPDDD